MGRSKRREHKRKLKERRQREWGPNNLRRVRARLESFPPGPIPVRIRRLVARGLFRAWYSLEGPGSRSSWVVGQAEEIEWDPPRLTFQVWSRCGPPNGGRRDLQRWTVDLEGRRRTVTLLERKLYGPHGWLGLLTMLIVDVSLFGPVLGLLAWVGMIFWFPILGNVINGIGHAIGYRNFGTKDHSRNIVPIGFVVAGEELHNNHHADPRSAKFKARWWELDIGWVYIKALSLVKLANVVYARSLSAREFAEKYYASTRKAAGQAVGEAKLALSRRYDETIEAAEAYYAEKKQSAEDYYAERRQAAEALYAERKEAADRLVAEARAEAARLREQLNDEIAARSTPRTASE